jgi:MFS family permease
VGEDDRQSGRQTRETYAVLRFRDFRFLLFANFLASLAQAMISVTVGWELYQRTGSALALGMVGLVQIVPNVLVSLPAGQYVDRTDQQRVAVLATMLVGAAAAGLATISFVDGPYWSIYVCLFLIGIARAFRSPTQGALLAAIIPSSHFSDAAAWSSSASQTASILGPALGGLGVAMAGAPGPVYTTSAIMLVVCAGALGILNPRPIERSVEKLSVDSLLSGIRFLYRTKVLFAGSVLDMVGVLFGGAMALLPIFAEDVLHVGSTGLGFLRAAPAIGAVITSLVVAHRGPFMKAGPTFLLTVVGFGAATVLFGASRSMALSLVALGLVGAFDSISMVIRHTMTLTYTPDHMRGRVGAVNYVFIGMSNEFGDFFSGALAAMIGATAAVILGGMGTLAVVPVAAWLWPEIRRLGEIRPVVESEPVATVSGDITGNAAGSSGREAGATRI